MDECVWASDRGDDLCLSDGITDGTTTSDRVIDEKSKRSNTGADKS